MVYLDTSVALASLLVEDRQPEPALWTDSLVSSRLLEFEVWNRVNKLPGRAKAEEATRNLLGRVALLELIPEVVSRAREPFPIALRTLDALHLASVLFLNEQGVRVKLASYDERMLTAARKLRVPLFEI
ncbi:MAG TPA: PIN domain-containing protein [Longimicrobiales bacterium]|nr:PIN domain-containing protein [Longimicrobiales bacterium]